jgi:hypothetical protein
MNRKREPYPFNDGGQIAGMVLGSLFPQGSEGGTLVGRAADRRLREEWEDLQDKLTDPDASANDRRDAQARVDRILRRR